MRVIRTLERIAAWRGYPAKLRLDNGPEFVALALAEWTELIVITLGGKDRVGRCKMGLSSASMAASAAAS